MKIKMLIIIITTLIVTVVLGGSFRFFDNTVMLYHAPFGMIFNEDSYFGIGIGYSTSKFSYTEAQIGFLKIKKISEKFFLDTAIFVGNIFGGYVSIAYENINLPISSQNIEVFVSNNFSFFSRSSRTFYTIGPLVLNTESFSFRKDQTFSYSFSRYFLKYGTYSGYYISINNSHMIGYLYPLDRSLEEGVLIGIGTRDFSQLLINGGIRKFFKLNEFRGFSYIYSYYDNSNNSFNFFGGIKFLAPLKGDLIIDNGKVSFRISW
ncbi:hypothetical protein JYK00_03435 [Thermosipho ferrireducens]|uniref:Uncharacterized protein n=1 Tax=Thermosipho ferrireducens TaxID=2571116 RepID=A0ABX7S7L1_9BACT|nr:hypothetical protein [Thermosipho ferrireducens]QTA38577.1 hypothetical protein JYK00_03435 [Thermosipho ferrireducens]